MTAVSLQHWWWSLFILHAQMFVAQYVWLLLDNEQKHNQSYQWGLDTKIRPFMIRATCGRLMDKAPAVFLMRHIINLHFNYVSPQTVLAAERTFLTAQKPRDGAEKVSESQWVWKRIWFCIDLWSWQFCHSKQPFTTKWPSELKRWKDNCVMKFTGCGFKLSITINIAHN